jgi:hypothetical protein
VGAVAPGYTANLITMDSLRAAIGAAFSTGAAKKNYDAAAFVEGLATPGLQVATLTPELVVTE